MKKRKTFKTPNMNTRAERGERWDAIIADLDSDFNIKQNDSSCPFMIKISGEHDFPKSELDYISSKLKENRSKLLELIVAKGTAAIQIKTGDNLYSIFIHH